LLNLALAVEKRLTCCELHDDAPEAPNIELEFILSEAKEHFRAFVPASEAFYLIFLSFGAFHS